MRLEMLHDEPVSTNLRDGSGMTCAYPSTVRLSNGEFVCLHRWGREKHSYDGVLLAQNSSDSGRTWSRAAVAVDGRDLTPPRCPTSGGICQAPSGKLLVGGKLTEVTQPDSYVFSPEGMTQKRHVCLAQSGDLGRTWAALSEIDISAYPMAGVTKPFILPDGRLCVPLEVRLPSGAQGTAAVTSDDEGRSFSPISLWAGDPDGKVSLCDARFTILKDGRILMLLWTFLQGSEVTLPVHRSLSSDNGRTWSPPSPTGIVGQLAAPLALNSGLLLVASNYRQPPEGIRLWASRDGGETWDAPIQMWDARQCVILGRSIAAEKSAEAPGGVWDALPKFTFGTPDLVDVGDGTVLMTYYATLNGICHVRACRFRAIV